MKENYYLDVSKVLEEFSEASKRQEIFTKFSKFNCSCDEGEIKDSLDFLLLRGVLKEKEKK